jgi:hypothetical protein
MIDATAFDAELCIDLIAAATARFAGGAGAVPGSPVSES